MLNFLGNRRRLLTLRYLALFESGTSIEVRHLARVIRGVETGNPPRNVGTADYESAYNALIQTHLPKIDQRGLIQYHERRKTVTMEESLERHVVLSTIAQFVLSTGSSI
ncbi:hypothetical protein EXE49_10785 [Halorubrum sp. ASP121]|uniref:DUF7344 domain-containing protein n=1 Tax=Halorubrum sp. ASP121 TaxID=1855858 RepID=UPI0010F52DB3|nr:hypothetical protein [Halorubrum sp. ASP121]TKX49560.1 hypothetical protein EXE49_10785 [Halorubrum sp. ASP121]